MKKRMIASICAALAAATSAQSVLAASEYAVMPISEDMIIADSEVPSDYTDREQPTTDELEAIIKAVKPKFDIPEEYKSFEWDYYGGSTYSDPSWTLRWTSEDSENYAYVTVSCDKNGRITNYREYSSNRKEEFPVYAKNELVETAKNFIAKIAPDAHLYFDTANDAYGAFSSEYTYSFKRTENEIDYPDNNATVRINFVTGKVTGCTINYDYDIPVAPSENTITPEKAAEILGTEQIMKLSYTRLTEKDENGKTVNKAILVYTPTLSYVSVDAVTGEIYHEKSAIINGTAGGGSDSSANKLFGTATEDSAESEEGGYRLTEEELAQLEVLEGLITKDEAIKKITGNSKLYLDVSLTAVNADLSRKYYYTVYEADEDKKNEYVWNISFSNPADSFESYYYPYAYATVDAKTGEIITFESGIKDIYYYENAKADIPEKQFTDEQCEAVFAEFAKENIPEMWDLTQKSSGYETNVLQYKTDLTGDKAVRTPVYGAYGYNFTRYNEGLPFTYDSIRGSVDGVTGKIFSYSYNWTKDVVFESPANAISAEEAFRIFCDIAQLDTYYERYDEYTLSLDSAAAEDKFKAFVIELKQNTADFESIIDKYAPGLDKGKMKEALMAADEAGIIELAAEYFGVDEIPDSDYFYDSLDSLYERSSVARLVYKTTSTTGIRISALRGERVNYSGKPYEEAYADDYSDISGHWAERYITLMADLGVLTRSEKFMPDEYITREEFESMLSGASFFTKSENEQNSSEITRLDAVKLIIDALGYGKIAALEGIYRTEFADNPDISEKDVGYLAIAYGFGIIDGDAGTKTFRPDERITKAEAVKLTVEATKIIYR